jgi:hypothetical protein
MAARFAIDSPWQRASREVSVWRDSEAPGTVVRMIASTSMPALGIWKRPVTASSGRSGSSSDRSSSDGGL